LEEVKGIGKGGKTERTDKPGKGDPRPQKGGQGCHADADAVLCTRAHEGERRGKMAQRRPRAGNFGLARRCNQGRQNSGARIKGEPRSGAQRSLWRRRSGTASREQRESGTDGSGPQKVKREPRGTYGPKIALADRGD